MNTIAYVDLEIADGTTVKLSTAMILQYKLRNKNEEAYEKLKQLLWDGTGQDMLQVVLLLYYAYICANIDSEEPLMT